MQKAENVTYSTDLPDKYCWLIIIATINPITAVTPIEAIGKEFDPNFHNAVMQVESEEFEPGTVAQELMKGYTCKGKVIRYSMVKVAN